MIVDVYVRKGSAEFGLAPNLGEPFAEGYLGRYAQQAIRKPTKSGKSDVVSLILLFLACVFAFGGSLLELIAFKQIKLLIS